MKGFSKFKPISTHFSWWQYILSFFLFAIFTVLPVLMFGGFELMLKTGYYAIWFFLYWAAIALIFCLVTAYQKYQAFDKPMRMLSEGAKKVASGDFSVYLKPLNPPKHQNDVDRMFQDFNTMVTELGSIETMKNDFIATVSHEFKTPLAIIQNYASAVENEDLDPQTRHEYLETLRTASGNLAEMVTNILRLNKIENQTIPLHAASYDVCAQLCDCVAGFSDKLDEKNLELDADMEDTAEICADREMLLLVWNNLLSNAIKFTEPGGEIRIQQFSDAETVMVKITDTGCGMDAETLRHIFDKFYQGDSSHSKEGNGLGLALVRRVLELFHGKIEVESKIGEGSTFTVTLPRKFQ